MLPQLGEESQQIKMEALEFTECPFDGVTPVVRPLEVNDVRVVTVTVQFGESSTASGQNVKVTHCRRGAGAASHHSALLPHHLVTASIASQSE